MERIFTWFPVKLKADEAIMKKNSDNFIISRDILIIVEHIVLIQQLIK